MDLEYIAQDNRITTARYELSLIEKRIVYFMIKEIRNKYVLSESGQRNLFDNLVIKLKLSSLVKGDQNPKEVREALMALRVRSFQYQEGGGGKDDPDYWFECGYINYGTWKKGTGEVEIEVSKMILPFFIELTKRFTEYSLTVAMSLRSKWSQRFYELCSQWKTGGGFNIDVLEIRKQFKIEEKYSRYATLKKYVLDVAHKELKELYDSGQSDLYFEYSEVKKGRSVKSLRFKVISSTQQEMKVTNDDMMYYIRTELRVIFQTSQKPKNQKFIGSLLRELTIHEEKIKHCYKKVIFTKNNLPKEEHAKYLRFIIKDEYLSND